MSRYMVTGAAGFVGSHLVEQLLADGHDVVGIDSFTPYYDRRLKEENVRLLRDNRRFQLRETDITALGALDHVGEINGIFHLAAQAGVRASWGQSFDVYLRDNLLATQRIFEQAISTEVRVIFVSSSSVYGDAERYPTDEDTVPEPVSPYGITKLTCEHLARAYALSGLRFVSLRYFTVYGPRQRPDMAFTRIARALLSDGTFELYGTGEQTRDVTYVADAVSATVAAMERGKESAVYNVGGGSETSLKEAMRLFEAVAGRTLELEVLPTARGDVTRTASDTTAIRSDTGWAPKVPVEEGIQRHFAWARATQPVVPSARHVDG